MTAIAGATLTLLLIAGVIDGAPFLWSIFGLTVAKQLTSEGKELERRWHNARCTNRTAWW